MRSHSGPCIATWFHRLLAAVFLLAWLSLLRQVEVLIGSRGLLPIADLLATPEAHRLDFLRFPTLFLWRADDWILVAGLWWAIALSLVWLAGYWPRICSIVSAFLYLSYATAARDFLHFQWDNMLIECGVLAALLPRDRPAPWIHFLFRVLLFKLYFESGIAKWQSHLGDWHDGSAMMFYYETAPLPTWLAWYAHALPQWWHQLESRLVLVLELAVPFGIFAPRRARLATAVALTGFQLVNIATANYGFFCYLSLALHVFLLDEPRRGAAAGTARMERPGFGRIFRRLGAAAIAVIYIATSLLEGVLAFAPPQRLPAALTELRRAYTPFRAINTYHLFAHITRERIEPEFQTLADGEWRTHHLRHKPGDPGQPPPFVAPHQPRVDFRLWFYGLSFGHGTPQYVQALAQRLCHDPGAVADLFAQPLPAAPDAVRLAFWRYRFTTDSGAAAWWHREHVAETHAIDCRTIEPPRRPAVGTGAG